MFNQEFSSYFLSCKDLIPYECLTVKLKKRSNFKSEPEHNLMS